ncbi:helix-turn-helix domain-containing protein [Streptomyces sp. NPDC059063]|uniref:helix-turn-helix domain-containing protein n=1 Tax=Streptomyces sp. NPDC059063 TaxID=3346712 RepID=UPI00369671B9
MFHLDTERLREEARKAGHWTHGEIAEHAGVDRSAVTRLLGGQLPTVPTLCRLARAYGIPLDDFVLGPDVPAGAA